MYNCADGTVQFPATLLYNSPGQGCTTAALYSVKNAFDVLYQQMHGMTLREMDRIVDAVCVLCTEHERNGFIEGVKVGIGLAQEI